MQNERIKKQTRRINNGIVKNHIENNFKYYIIVTIIFIVGVVLGVIYINNANNIQAKEISNYINDFINKIKENTSVDYTKLLIDSIKQNLILALILWFSGLTVVGVIAVYGIIAYKGFCIRLQYFKHYS